MATMSIAISTLLFLTFALSSASDMSIISYNTNNNNQHQQSTGRSDAEVMDIYTSWMAKHGKAYNGLGENERRYEIFKDNLRFIDEHNRQNRTYKVGLNSFADLTNEEYRAIYLGTRTDPKRRITKSKNPSQRYAFRASEKLPASVDWRVKGAINPIKNQGSCGKGNIGEGGHEVLKLRMAKMAQVGCRALNPEAILQQTIGFQRSTKIRSLSPQNQIGARALRCVGRRELSRKGLSTNFSCKLF